MESGYDANMHFYIDRAGVDGINVLLPDGNAGAAMTG
jgi:hypothetical protein